MIYPHYAEDSLWPILLCAEFGLVSSEWYSHPITWPNLTSATGLLLHVSCCSTLGLLPPRREARWRAKSRRIRGPYRGQSVRLFQFVSSGQ